MELKEIELEGLLTKLILFAGHPDKSKEVNEIKQEIINRFNIK